MRYFCIVAIAWMLTSAAGCDAPTRTIAELQNGGIALKGRRAGLKGKVTNAEVPRTRRLVRIGNAESGLQAFELSDGTARVVVWYDPSHLSKALERGDHVAVDAHITFPEQATGFVTDMVVVAREVRFVTEP